MASNKYYLGDLISQRREKNPGGDLPIRGVSKEGLQPPKQIDADTSIYNLYYRNDFVYNPARMELGSIAFNDEYDRAICSSLYEVFYVHRLDLVIPEYLALFVKHPEFARYCNYIGNGSAREYCRFDNISGIPIYLPPISEQRKIVHDYQVITDRIKLLRKIDDNLFQTAKAYMINLYETDDAWQSDVTINDYCHNIASGGTPNRSENSYWENASIPWLKNGEIKNNVIVDTDEYISKTGMDNSSARLFPAYSIHMAMYCVSEIQVAISCIPLTTNQAVLNFEFDGFRKASFFYYLLATYGNEITSNANGSAQQNLSKELITAFVFKKPRIEKEYFTYFEKNLDYRISIAKELASMQTCADLVLTHL